MKKGFLFISCEEAIHISDKAQYGEASLWEKFELKLRLSWCNITRSYATKNQKLSEVFRKSNLKSMGNKDRESIKLIIQQELKKQQ
jgi:hypothetical protein